jgi:tagatose 6-phosphate kinase
MTLVICPNLAVDRMLAGDLVRPGGMTRCRALRTQAGGKGANVLRATLALGGEGLLTGFAAGRGGRLIAELANDEGLELEVLAAEGEARVSTVVLGDDGSVTRLYEFGPEVTPADERALAHLAGSHTAGRDEWAVICGAAPPGASPGFYAALIRTARSAGYRVLVDATGEQLAGALAERPDLVKVNLAEACSAVGAPEAHGADEKEEAQALEAEGLELCRRLVAAGAAGAVLTLAAAGTVAVLDGTDWRVATRRVRAVNPVGSGDCFAAGLTLALERGESTAAALRLAAAAGAANATSPYNGDVDRALAEELAGDAYAGPPA